MNDVNIVKILNYRNLNKAIKRATRGRFKYKNGAIKFNINYPYSLSFLKEMINSYEYRTKGYGQFLIKDSKKRIIHVPCFTDKLMQYSINNILAPVLENMYIKDSYACIKGKGPQKAVLRLKYFQYKAYRIYKNPILIKIDIKSFFYSINRAEVFDILCGIIKCEDTRILLAEILKFLPSSKGLPLGNLTSQQFANMLLNKFDQYAKRTLRLEFYLRYADDIFIIVHGKFKAKKILELSKTFLKDKLDLTPHPKKCYYEPANNIIGLGHRIVYNKNAGKNKILLLSRNKNKLYKILKIKEVTDKSLTGLLNRDSVKDKNKSLLRPATIDDILIRLNSWNGHAKLVKLDRYIQRVLKRNNIKNIFYTGEKFMKVDV